MAHSMGDYSWRLLSKILVHCGTFPCSGNFFRVFVVRGMFFGGRNMWVPPILGDYHM